MITKKDELRNVLKMEYDIYNKRGGGIKTRYFFDKNENKILWNYCKVLRKFEYYKNNNAKIFSKLYRILHNRNQMKTGILISINSVEPGLSIAHLGSIIINSQAKVGKNFRVHPGVVIGNSNGKSPIIGNNVYFGPGAKAYGDIYIADNCQVGANAVVNKSCESSNSLLVGVPAMIKNRN